MEEVQETVKGWSMLSKEGPRVLVCQPVYRGVEPASMLAAHDYASQTPGRTAYKAMESPMLCANFNALWAYAINSRKKIGWTHIAFLHQDVNPSSWWVDKSLEVMAKNKVQWLSCILRMKDDSGLTSTAVLDKSTLSTRRLARKEIVNHLPSTFTSKDLVKLGHKDALLLHGSGMFLVDMSAPWFNRVWWEAPSRLLFAADDSAYAAAWDEGWNISLQVYALGGTIACTTEVPAEHIGGGRWSMEEPTEEWETDGCWTDQTWILGKIPEKKLDRKLVLG